MPGPPCRPPPPLQGTPQALPGHPSAPRLPLSQQAAAEQCKGPGAPSPAREASSSPTAKNPSWGRGRSLQPGPLATFPRENLTPPLPAHKPSPALASRGIGCSEVFSHLRFPTISDSLAERSNQAQSRREQREHLQAAPRGCLRPREDTGCPPSTQVTPRSPQLLLRPPSFIPLHQGSQETGTPGSRHPLPRQGLESTQGRGLTLPSCLALCDQATSGSLPHRSSERTGPAGTCSRAL